MRKAEEYATECHNSDKFDFAKHSEIIKRVIIEVIDEAVKRCASKVTHTAGQWYSDYSCMKWNVEKVADQFKKELE